MAGQTKEVGWECGARRTYPIDLETAWNWLTSPAGVALWLGLCDDLHSVKGATYRTAEGAAGEVRVINPQVNLRLTWQKPDWSKPSTLQIRTIPASGGTTISFHQENLPGPAEREEMLARWQGVLDRITVLLKGD